MTTQQKSSTDTWISLYVSQLRNSLCLLSKKPAIDPCTFIPPSSQKSACVAAIVRYQNHSCKHDSIEYPFDILFIRRAIISRDMWSAQTGFPGGKCNRNETIQQTAERETREEIGLDISEKGHKFAFIGILDTFDMFTTTSKYISIKTYVLFYMQTCYETNTELQLNKDEISSAVWIDFAQLCSKPAFVNSKTLSEVVYPCFIFCLFFHFVIVCVQDFQSFLFRTKVMDKLPKYALKLNSNEFPLQLKHSLDDNSLLNEEWFKNINIVGQFTRHANFRTIYYCSSAGFSINYPVLLLSLSSNMNEIWMIWSAPYHWTAKVLSVMGFKHYLRPGDGYGKCRYLSIFNGSLLWIGFARKYLDVKFRICNCGVIPYIASAENELISKL